MDLHLFPSCARQKACRYGQMLYNINDMYVGRSFDLYGEFSQGEVEMFQQIVQPGHAVLDIGANIGAHTIYLARRVGPQGVVVAFEPQRLVHQMLCANLSLNSISNTWVFFAAVGPKPDHIVVPVLDYLHENNFGGLGLGEFTAGETVQVMTVDGLNLNRCNFMKVDVEGMEEQVLRGAVHTIARHRPILYVENDRPKHSEGLIRFIDSLGYAMYWHDPRLYNPDNFFKNPENIFGRIASLNMLCLHKDLGTNVAGLPKIDPHGPFAPP